MKAFDRRSFLASAAAVTAAAALPASVRAIEPIARWGKPKFKFSLAAYSYRDLFKAKTATLEDFIRDCAKLQLEGTELTSYYFPEDLTPEYLRSIKQLAFCEGLDISGTAIANDFCLVDSEKRQEQIAHVKRWIDNAEILGAPVIRIFAGKVGKQQSEDEARRLIIEGIEECCEYAGQHGVYLALENHGGPTATIDGILAIIQGVKSPWFGANLDSGNFASTTAYEDLARLAPYAVNVQIKVVIKRKGSEPEPSDFRKLAKILTDAGYRGYVVLEYEEAKDPREECRRYLGLVREAFAG
jgi:sugar phosphate isomerase/epimerase